MLPIAQLPADVARSLEGVCFDIDDTVTTGGVLDPEAYAALFALRASGLKLAAVTGRPLGWAEIVARTWPVDFAVGENGAGHAARTPSGLALGYWDDEATRRQQAGQLRALCERVARELPQIAPASDAWARRCDVAFDLHEFAAVSAPDVGRLVALLREEGARVTVSSVHAHAQLGAHDKASGVVRAAQTVLGLDEDRVRTRFLFVGDSGNDAAAFDWFQVTAGVANVRHVLDRLPTPPRFVAQAPFGRGFAEIAHSVLARRQP